VGAKEQQKRQLWGRDFDVVKDGLDEKQVVSFVNDLMERQGTAQSTSVRSVIKTAIAEAEKIIDSVAVRAKAEAGEESAGIAVHENRKAEETVSKPEEDIEKGMEDTLPEVAESAQGKTGATEQLLAEINREAETPAQLQDETDEEKTAETLQVPEEPSLAEPVERKEAELSEQPIVEETDEQEEEENVLLKQDRNSLYTGEVEISIDKPVDPKMVSKLYNYLQTTPEIKFVRTSGSWERGTTIAVSLDKPVSLISVLSSKIPEANIVPVRPEKGGFVGKRGVRNIRLTLKKG
jgi:hypothetical protein